MRPASRIALRGLPALLLCLLIAAGARAQEFRRWAESARGLGMGGALTAVATGSDAMLYNPAGLVQEQFWKVELAYSEDKSDDPPGGVLSDLDHMPGTPAEVDALLQDARKSRYERDQRLATFHNGRGLGVGAIDVQTRQIERSSMGIDYREERLTGGMFTLAWATDLRLFMWGLTVRSLGRQLIEEEFTSNELTDPAFKLNDYRSTGNDVTYDLGVLMRLPIPGLRPTIGVAQLNGNDPDFGFKSRPGIPGEVNAGIALNPALGSNAMNLLLTTEWRDVTENAFETKRQQGKRFHWGGEFSLFPLANGIWGLQLRVGESQGYPSLGAGINLAKYLSVDIAHYTEELGNQDNPEKQRRTIASVKVGF